MKKKQTREERLEYQHKYYLNVVKVRKHGGTPPNFQKDNVHCRAYVNKNTLQITLAINKKELKPKMWDLLLSKKKFELKVVAAD